MLIPHLTKTVNGTKSDEMHFFYDAQGRPAMVKHGNNLYRYVHNLQGDILGMIDGADTLVVEYKCDAWGRLLSMAGTFADPLEKRNPFRYRGNVCAELDDAAADLRFRIAGQDCSTGYGQIFALKFGVKRSREAQLPLKKIQQCF